MKMDGSWTNEWSKCDEKLMVRNSNKEHLKSAINFTHHQISSCLVPPLLYNLLYLECCPSAQSVWLTAFDKLVSVGTTGCCFEEGGLS